MYFEKTKNMVPFIHYFQDTIITKIKNTPFRFPVNISSPEENVAN